MVKSMRAPSGAIAWRIADPGASNPVAVAGTLAQASSALLRKIGTDGVKKYPALRVIAGQLSGCTTLTPLALTTRTMRWFVTSSTS